MTTVLVIDDSPSEMAKFREILTKNDFTMLEATNGERGIELAIEEVPDIILMDVVMPEMNGFQATRKISRNKSTSHIPIVIVSTKNQETDKVWGQRQGAKDYLTKPFTETELLNAIDGVLQPNNAQKTTKKSTQTASAKSSTSSQANSSSVATTTEVQVSQQKPSNGIYL